MKTITYGPLKLSLEVTTYAKHGNTAICLWAETEEGPEEYSTLTVNLDERLPEDFAYIDVNNNSGLLKILVANGLATETGIMGMSGFCTYPLVRLNLDKIKEYGLPKKDVSA